MSDHRSFLNPGAVASRIKRRWRNGETPNAASLFRQHPELAKHRSLVIDIALEEFCVRRESGQEVNPRDFCSQFPDVRRSLARQIEVYDWMEQHPDVASGRSAVNWPQLGTSFLGKYLIRDELGRGSLARAYLCEQLGLGNRQVVLKVASGGEYEAGTLGRLNHPSIMPVHSVDVDRDTGVSGICMPFHGRSTLDDLLELAWRSESEIPPVSVDVVYEAAGRLQQPGDIVDSVSQRQMPIGTRSFIDAIRVIAQDLTDALRHAHDFGIVHGDLKPSNILLTSEGRPLLMDFNLSSDRLLEGGPMTGGTLPYMSPEQLRSVVLGLPGAVGIDWRSDLFSLGVILYELLTGHLPFTPPALPPDQIHRTAHLMLELQRRGPINPSDWNSTVDRDLSLMVLHCLQFDCLKRPTSLPKWRQSPLPSPEIPAGSEPRSTTKSTMLGVIGLVMLAVSVGITAMVYQPKPPVSNVAAVESKRPVTSFEKGLELVNDEDWLEAVGQFNTAIEHSASEEERGKSLAMAGYCYQQLPGKFYQLESESCYRKAYDAGFDSLGVVNNLGVCCQGRRMPSYDQESVAWFELALKIAPESIAPKLNLLVSARDDLLNCSDYFPLRLVGIAEELLAICPDKRNVTEEAALVFTRCAHHDEEFFARAIELWQSVVAQGNGGIAIRHRDRELMSVLIDDARFPQLESAIQRAPNLVDDVPRLIHPLHATL